jgi:hypothetical protein
MRPAVYAVILHRVLSIAEEHHDDEDADALRARLDRSFAESLTQQMSRFRRWQYLDWLGLAALLASTVIALRGSLDDSVTSYFVVVTAGAIAVLGAMRAWRKVGKDCAEGYAQLAPMIVNPNSLLQVSRRRRS